LLGKSGSTNNCALIHYHDDDVTDYLGFGFYNNSDIIRIYTNHNVEITNGHLTMLQADADADQSLTFINNSIDCGRLRFYESSIELATGDTGTEPIYVRQYTGDTSIDNGFATLINEATLLDANGNTQFPNTLTAKQNIIQNTDLNANVMLKALTPNSNTTSILIGKNDVATNASAVLAYHYDATPTVSLGFNDNANLFSVNTAGNTYIYNSSLAPDESVAISIGKNKALNNFTTRYNYILEPNEQDPEILLDKSSVSFDLNNVSNVLTIEKSQIQSLNDIHSPNIDDMSANKVNRNDIILNSNGIDVLNTTSIEGNAIQHAITHVSAIENDLQVNGTLTTTSDIFCEGTVTQSSDRTLKQDIKPISNTNILDKINTYSFTFINDSNHNKHYGVIAQELQELLPELVHENPRTHKLTVDYIEFIPHLINKIQQLDAKNKRQNVVISSLFVLFMAFVVYSIWK
jgi:hypothetical protein